MDKLEDIENLRGILSEVLLTEGGNLVGTFTSEGFMAGDSRIRGSWRTSSVNSIDVVEGQLVVFTRSSAYIIEGEIKTTAGVLLGERGE